MNKIPYEEAIARVVEFAKMVLNYIYDLLKTNKEEA